MKHNPNPRRGRNRGNGKRHVPLRNQTFESNGPDGKIRGTAQQVLDRYLALGRDATSAGDPITAESFFQHAEHYFRLLHTGEFANGDRTNSQPSRPDGEGEQPGEEDNMSSGAVDSSEEPVDRLPF